MSTRTEPRPPLRPTLILSSAREMLAAEGLSAVSLRRLAGQLGVTAPALYAHFENKDALLGALAAQEFMLLGERLEQAAHSSPDPIERITAQCHAYVEHALENPALFQLMTRYGPAWVAEPGAAELPEASRSFEVSAAAVRDAIAAGLLRERDELLASLTLWAASHGVATVLLSRPGLGADYEASLVDSVIDSVVRGLLAD